jgi:hypothetical protein
VEALVNRQKRDRPDRIETSIFVLAAMAVLLPLVSPKGLPPARAGLYFRAVCPTKNAQGHPGEYWFCPARDTLEKAQEDAKQHKAEFPGHAPEVIRRTE